MTKGMTLKKRPLNGSLFASARQSTSALSAQKLPVVTGFAIAAIALLRPFRGTRLVLALESCIAPFTPYGHDEKLSLAFPQRQSKS